MRASSARVTAGPGSLGAVRPRRGDHGRSAGRDGGGQDFRAVARRAVPGADQRTRPRRTRACQVIEVNPDALAIADALDAERKARGPARPAARHPGPDQGQHRHRRPDDHDRRLARALADRSPPRDAFVVQRLRAAGAVHPRQDQPERVGELPRRRIRPAAGAAAAGRRAIRTRSIATPAARAPAPAPRSRRTSRPSASAPRPTARSSARPRQRRWSASSRRSAWSAAPASSRSRTARTRPGRWRARSPTPPRCSTAMAGVDPRDPATAAQPPHSQRRLHASSSTPTGCAARASASRATLLRLQRRSRCARRTRRSPSCDDKGASSSTRRTSRRSASSTTRVRGAALRVQGRPQRVPRVARADVAGPLARRRHRVQRGARAEEMPYFGQEILRDGREEGAATETAYRKRAGEEPAPRRAQKASTA